MQTSVFHLGLIGFPLGHSLSPALHTAALRSCELEGDYSLFPVPPDDAHGLKSLLARVRNGELHGLNVTIPHKQNVIPLLDELTPTAQAIGAVNTIYLREGKLFGDNTDAQGFLSDLKKFLANRVSPIADRKSALVLGAGGSARAVVYVLLNDGWQVTIAARRIEQAQELADYYATRNTQHVPQTTELHNFILHLSSFILVVNTTPLGMISNTDQSPWPENLSFPRHAAIYDLVYNPPETKFVRAARVQGLSATTGLGMLVEQAALSFELWTGRVPSRELMRQAVET